MEKINKKSMAGFSVKEILQATSGRLLQGNLYLNIKSISTDTRSIKQGEVFVAIKGNNFDGHDFIGKAIRKSASVIIISDKKQHRFPTGLTIILVKDTTRAFGDIARLHRRRFNIPVIAITGSNGKTTAKEMVAAVLGQKFKVLKNEGTKNNHIGVPQTLLKLNSSHEAAVLEMGTNHPGEIAYLARIALPTIAVITNIGDSHLEFFKTREAIFKEKQSLLQGLKKNGKVVLNNDDPFLSRIKSSECKITTVGIKEKSDFIVGDIYCRDGRVNFTVNHKLKLSLSTPAPYNIYNALLAVACGNILGVSHGQIIKALSQFSFPPGRFTIKKLGSVRVIDDTYNSNPTSLRIAIEVLAGYDSNRRILVCADMKELGDKSVHLHFGIGKDIARLGIDELITVGELARYIAVGARTKGMSSARVYEAGSIQQAASRLSKIMLPRDVVLIKGSRAMGMEKIIEILFRS